MLSCLFTVICTTFFMRKYFILILFFFFYYLVYINFCLAQPVFIHSIDRERTSVCSGIDKDVANHLYGVGIINKTPQYKTNILFVYKWDEQEQLIWKKEWSATNYYLEPKVICSGSDVYITGTFFEKMEIDGRVLTAANPKIATAFLVKLDNMGKVIWLNKLDSETFVDIRAITLTKEGNILCAGGFIRNVKIGNSLLEGNNSMNSLLIAYNEEGKMLWARHDKSKYSSLSAIAIDKENHILIGGRFRDNLHWDEVALTNAAPNSIAPFVGCLDEKGNAIWFRSTASMGYTALVYDIVTDKSNDIYLTGMMTGVGDWKEQTTANREKEEGFLTKYSAKGEFQWVQTLGGKNNNEYDAGMNIKIDKDENIWWVGNITLDTNQIAGLPVEIKGELDIFRLKCNKDGKIVEAKTWGGSNKEWIKAVLSDSKENIYIAGFYYVETEWGDTYLTSLSTQKQGFIAKLPNPNDKQAPTIAYIPPTFIEIGPNPTREDFSIRINDLKVPLVNFSIKDNNGRVILNETTNPVLQFKRNISATSWAEGVYILTFEFENGAVLTRKVVKEAL